jgi:hypothetical protein
MINIPDASYIRNAELYGDPNYNYTPEYAEDYDEYNTEDDT